MHHWATHYIANKKPHWLGSRGCDRNKTPGQALSPQHHVEVVNQHFYSGQKRVLAANTPVHHGAHLLWCLCAVARQRSWVVLECAANAGLDATCRCVGIN
eukprot:9492383-Alexandrium_andersonii.AAC.1